MHAATQHRSSDLGLFLIRAKLAAVFFYHGSQKLIGWFGGYGLEATAEWMATIGIPFPKLNAVLASVTEVAGAIVLVLGTGTRVAAVPLAFTMLVAKANPQKYDELGRSAVAGKMRQAPALAGGLLYLRDEREIVCLDVRKP